MSFAKLDHGIVKSSIWNEPLATRVLWITMLAIKDENGFVSASKSGLARIANISQEQFEIGIKTLESPDADSRTPDNEGRRIEKIDGGWAILNDEKYRLPEDEQREYMREYMRKYRAGKVNSKESKFTSGLPSISISVSKSVSKSELINSGDCKGGNDSAILYERFTKAFPNNGSQLNPEVQNWFLLREAEHFTNFEKVIAAAENYSNYWRELEPENYPNCHFMKIAINWLRDKSWETDWLAKLDIEKRIAADKKKKKGAFR